jgi:hypothetical protein
VVLQVCEVIRKHLFKVVCMDVRLIYEDMDYNGICWKSSQSQMNTGRHLIYQKYIVLQLNSILNSWPSWYKIVT